MENTTMVTHNIVLYRPTLIPQVPPILQSNAGSQLTFWLPFNNYCHETLIITVLLHHKTHPKYWLYSFVCFSVCSAAELTRYHFAQATAIGQLKGVISQNALMMAETLELTGLQGGERWHAV